jgi:rfaE bifunctional protein nucleotidyltransferase chain/domain
VSPGAPAFEAKLCPPGGLAARLAGLSRPLVFTNGCFDILHRGHVTYLAQARALGASLVVGVNTDASVRRLGKGVDRPVNALEDRMAVLAALESVSLVTWFDEDTPLELIRTVQPDVLAKIRSL